MFATQELSPITTKEYKNFNDLTHHYNILLPVCKNVFNQEFIVDQTNIQALKWIYQAPHWPNQMLIIRGPKGCGKTHLVSLATDIYDSAVILAKDVSANKIKLKKKNIIIDGIEKINDLKDLIHLHDYIKYTGGSLLLTCNSLSKIYIPDLISRVNVIPLIDIQSPTQDLFQKIAMQFFINRGILVNEETVKKVASDTERSAHQLKKIIYKIDQIALQLKKPITNKTIKELMFLTQNCSNFFSI